MSSSPPILSDGAACADLNQARWQPRVKWNGSPLNNRKLWLRAGRCWVEVYSSNSSLHYWKTYDRGDCAGNEGQAPSLREAMHAGITALLLQHRAHAEQGVRSPWHIGARSMQMLLRVAALDALGG